MAERGLVFSLKQVRRYFSEPELRAQVHDRLARQISADTKVIVAHSLGSVVAYEALCANPAWPVRSLITLGSPLGTRNLIFDRLAMPGAWPGSIKTWTNIAADDDVVALLKDLRPLFGERVVNVAVGNGARAHDVTRYLTAEATGTAIRDGLVDG